ncbi:translation initiation factor IF-2 [Thermodesulfobacteriota bacterium]
MAKVRVYELAKELNMESKQLVEKLKAGGLNIKNYMSTLDGEATKKARDIVNNVTSEVVEEKRIKPTVIRRRKKIIKFEEEKKEIKEEEKAAEPIPEKVEEIPPVVEEKTLPKEKKPSKKAKPAEKIAKPKVKAKKAKKKPKDRPAKIIKMPEEGPLKGIIAKEKKEKIPDKKPDIEAPPAEEIKAVPEEVTEKPAKKRKDKRKATKEEIDARGRIRHRKLEVFERADLYEDRRPRVKDRKAAKKSKEAAKILKQTAITVPRAIKRRLRVQEEVTVAELAKAMGIKGLELIKKLMALGIPGNINMAIDFETASVLADEFGYELELDLLNVERIIDEVKDKPEDLKPRSPVVTIMGHVDHGKTSLLDYIRQSNIIGGESGGITQHIGAYHVKTKGGDIAFLDTPGHEAFTAMRARGAKVTDIIILVVAADDGVMPQTKEAINHARAANIPIIVAINKIDKPEANPEKVTRELSELELAPEEWGGDIIFGKISAKTGEGINELMELILLQAEILELNANPNKAAKGTIIEAKLDKGKGSVATVLIQEGTLHQSDYFICGENYGKIRAMLNNRGKKIESAGPSIPVEVYGISGVPMAGDEFIVVKDEKSARQVVTHRQNRMKEKEKTRTDIVSLDDLYEKIKEGKIKELNIILKADVQGSLEALSDSMEKLGTDEVKLKIIHSSAGAITESDVMLASASGAIVIGFRVRANPRVVKIAEKEKVDIRYYDVIYNLIEDIRKAMVGLLEPTYKENTIGRVDIKEIFKVPRVGTVAGCYVTDGYIDRNAMIRLLRDEVVVFDGRLASLKRFKGDVKEVQSGYECGVGLEDFQDIKPGDVFEVYEIEEIQAEL